MALCGASELAVPNRFPKYPFGTITLQPDQMIGLFEVDLIGVPMKDGSPLIHCMTMDPFDYENSTLYTQPYMQFPGTNIQDIDSWLVRETISNGCIFLGYRSTRNQTMLKNIESLGLEHNSDEHTFMSEKTFYLLNLAIMGNIMYLMYNLVFRIIYIEMALQRFRGVISFVEQFELFVSQSFGNKRLITALPEDAAYSEV